MAKRAAKYTTPRYAALLKDYFWAEGNWRAAKLSVFPQIAKKQGMYL